MKNYCYSKLNDSYYLFDGCIKIINLKQALFYIDRGVPIKDIYPSTNYQNGSKVLVFIVDKFESMKAYNEWQALADKNFECKNPARIESDRYVRVLNINQVIFFLENDTRLYYCKPVLDYKTQQPVLAFYFDKDESKEVYKRWIKKKS